jgi:magnesium transporter
VALADMIKKRAGWLAALFLGEMLTATAMGFFEDEIAARGGAGAVRAAHHLQRRQLRLAGLDPGDPGHGAGRGAPARLVAGVCGGSCSPRLALGVLLGTIGFIRIVAWQAVKPTYGEHYLLVAMTVFLTLVGW